MKKIEQLKAALQPFASIGQWLFARNLPDDTPVVEINGLHGSAGALTRGHFKAAATLYNEIVEQYGTPAALWRESGEPDPHGTQYDCERADLAMGQLTDDELANEVYVYDHRRGMSSLAYLTAAKERIRWLSRALVRATTQQAAAAAPQTLVETENDPAKLWAEIHRLRALVKGPDGYETWQDAAVAERSARVRAENLKGRHVSVDVSTGENDAGNRIFARLTGETGSDGETLLAEEISRNF